MISLSMTVVTRNADVESIDNDPHSVQLRRVSAITEVIVRIVLT